MTSLLPTSLPSSSIAPSPGQGAWECPLFPEDDLEKGSCSSDVSEEPRSPTPLENCLTLTQDLGNHEEATRQFQELCDHLGNDRSQMEELVGHLWQALLQTQRSAFLWERRFQTERVLSERIASSHYQLHQTYLRLLQEQ